MFEDSRRASHSERHESRSSRSKQPRNRAIQIAQFHRCVRAGVPHALAVPVASPVPNPIPEPNRCNLRHATPRTPRKPLYLVVCRAQPLAVVGFGLPGVPFPPSGGLKADLPTPLRRTRCPRGHTGASPEPRRSTSDRRSEVLWGGSGEAPAISRASLWRETCRRRGGRLASRRNGWNTAF